MSRFEMCSRDKIFFKLDKVERWCGVPLALGDLVNNLLFLCRYGA